MSARWLVVLLAAAVLVGTPLAVEARPAQPISIAADDLAERIERSAAVPWSGLAETSGTLQVPDSDSFANLAQLLGETNRLRVWWIGPDHWRVDRIRSTGETDLFRHGAVSIRWVFESETATITPVSTIRLPDASDLLPPTLGRTLLQGSRSDELASLPARRVAGVDAAGVRLTPHDPATTLDHVDVWAEPASGLPLRVEVYGPENTRPVLTTGLSDLDLAAPDPSTTVFSPAQQVTLVFEDSVDVAAAANASAPFDLPPTLAGLASRAGDDPGAVGIYGRGPTTMIALPLRRSVAFPLRERLRESTAARETATGTLASVGPVNVLVTRFGGRRSSFLLAGTVTADVLDRAVSELLGS